MVAEVANGGLVSPVRDHNWLSGCDLHSIVWMSIVSYRSRSCIAQCIGPTDKVHVAGLVVTSFRYCSVGGVYFKDLPANMLGSFIIGLVGTSNMLGIREHRAVGFLPDDHVWQANIPFQTGGF